MNLQKITVEPNEDKRASVADDLAALLSHNPSCGKSQDVVNKLTLLLKDRNDAVRYGAAESLSAIGPYARASVPALKVALAESDAKLKAGWNAIWNPVLPTSYSGQAIRDALRSITGENVLDYGDQFKK
jgi:HEAT repeat protein